MRRLVLALPIVLTLAACGGGRVTTVTVKRPTTIARSTTVGRLPVADRGSACTVYDRGTAEYVEVVAAHAAAGCLDLVERWSDRSGSFWSLYPGPGGAPSSDVLICSMRRQAFELDVYDDKYGSAPEGTAACGALASHGWSQVG